MVLACQAAVALALSLAGGIAGDRWHRSAILVISTAVRTAAAVLLAVVLLLHAASFAILLAVAIVYGCASGFFGPVSVAVLPDVVPADRLPAANALIGGLSASAMVVAPALAGVIVAAFGSGTGFALESVLLAVTAISLAAARIPAVGRDLSGAPASAPASVPDDAAASGAPAGDRGPLAQLRTGWRVFRRLRWLWLLTLQWTAFSLLVLAPVAVLGPAIALRYLGGAAAWGVISAFATGGLVAGQFAVGRFRPSRPVLVAACLCPAGVAEALALGSALRCRLSAPPPSSADCPSAPRR